MFINDEKPTIGVHRERDRGMEIYCKLEGLDSDYISAKSFMEHNADSTKKLIWIQQRF